ncbi:MAG: LysR family transcriptional regulator [Rhodoferax sp.]|nr:LysR family transcriptional regulator [Rhodoferax sp.]
MTAPAAHLAQALGEERVDKRIDILRRIGEVGSISEAARGAGVSYKAAWQALETLSNLAGQALVDKAVGGAGGGGARLTEAGEQLLAAAAQLQAARAAALQALSAPAGPTAAPGPAALGLRTSMRNHLPCHVAAIRRSGGLVRVQLRLGDGAPLVSRITSESVELLGLAPGLPVLALCKATAVAVALQMAPREGQNLLQGRVGRRPASGRGGEVSLTLPSGLQLVGFAAPDAALRLHQPAWAALEESAVVIALTG